MGKKRVAHLLEQLKSNQQAELENAAAIFTVAQVAVNELRERSTEAASIPIAELPAALPSIDRAELVNRYGSYKNCRLAAKQRGIKFRKTPTWTQLEAAFNYLNVLEAWVQDYCQSHPNPHLKGVSFEIRLD